MSSAPSTERRVWIPRRIDRQSLKLAGSGFPLSRLAGETMGTSWSATVAQPPTVGLPGIENAIEGAFDRVIRQMSLWDPDSEISRFNRAEAGSWHRLSPGFMEVLRRALEVARETDGIYNPAVGRAVDLLGFGPTGRADGETDTSAIGQAIRSGRWSEVEVDADSGSILQPGGVQLDLGSIAKGFAVDLAARGLAVLGIEGFLIEVGGEVHARGCKPDGQPWWCRLDQYTGAANATTIETVLALCDHSLAASGNGVRRRRIGGRWCGHILDGTQGPLAGGELEAVFVLHGNCMTADAYATALFALGLEKGLSFAEERNLAALFVPGGGMPPAEQTTRAWDALMEG